jgi:hypothetical protein
MPASTCSCIVAASAAGVDLGGERVHGLHEVVAHVGDHAAERRGDAGEARHDRAREADLGDQRAGVQRAAAAEGHVGEARRVMAALDRDEADGAGHAAVRDPHDRLGRREPVEPEGRADMGLDREARRLGVEARETADRPLGVDPAEHDVRVGHGRAVVAAPVGDGAGVGARALRPDLQEAARVDPGDRAATGADRRDLDHRRADDEAEVDAGLCRQRALAVRDQRHVEARAAHVAGDDVREPRGLGDVRRGDHPRRRPRERGAHRPSARRRGVHHAAVRLHDQELAAEAALGERRLEPREVARDLRLEVGVEGRRGEPLELADLGQDVARCGDVIVRPEAAQHLDRRPLVRGVGIGVDEEHRDRETALRDERLPAARTASRSTGARTVPSDSTRSGTSRRRSRGTTGSKPPRRPQVRGRSRRRISSTSRKPAVVITPTRAPLRSSSALVPAVVPCTTVARRARSGTRAAMPARKPAAWSGRVVGTLATSARPVASSSTKTSVKVPPTSMPTTVPGLTPRPP